MKKKWHLWQWFVLVTILLGIVLAIFQPVFGGLNNPGDFEWPATRHRIFNYALVGAAVVLLLVFFKFSRQIFGFVRNIFRRLFSWNFLKCALRVLAGLAVFLFLLFYVEENWRVKYVWKNYQREWEAKGEHFDFKSFVPPPVPDEQNFALTPIVATSYEWVLDKGGHELKPHRTNVVERLWMKVRHWPSEETVSGVQPTNGDWRVRRLCDLKSWQMYYRTPVTNMFLFVEETPNGKSSYWKPFTNSDSILTNDFAFPPTPESPAADVLLALSKYDSDIEELRSASRLSYSRFPLNYDAKPPQPVYLMHLASLKYCCQTLQLRAIAELENAESQKALDDVMLALRLVDSIRTEPSATSQYWRSEMMKTVIQIVWEGLARHKWSDAQLATIEQEFGKLDFLADCERSLRCTRNENLAMIDYWINLHSFRETRMFVHDMADSGFHSLESAESIAEFERQVTIMAWFHYLMPKNCYYQNQLTIARTYQKQILPAVDSSKHLFSPQKFDAVGKFIESLPHHRWSFVARRFLGAGFYSFTKKLVYAQETIDLARVACALERYHLTHGEYPETLTVLSPQFMEIIPHDIIGGQPLHYRRTVEGRFILYSVGWDETDDGGVVALNEASHWVGNQWVPYPNDWVWQYPAK